MLQIFNVYVGHQKMRELKFCRISPMKFCIVNLGFCMSKGKLWGFDNF